ncbi:MAG: hypothetical protein FWH36_04355 [Lentimicrobiaceae bacterium]|nr:hypothetical protein [Lentimicrobiaceae bacterium]
MSNRIKFLGLGMLFMLIATQAYSQKRKKNDGCKFEYQKNDAFTGEYSQRINVRHHNVWNVMEFWQFNFNKVGNDYDITLITTLGYTVPVQEGDSIIIRVVSDVDGTSHFLTLYASENSDPIRAAVGSTAQAVEYGQYTIKCNVTEEQLKLLVNSTAKVIRIAVKQNTDKEISDGEAKEIKKAANCIMQ